MAYLGTESLQKLLTDSNVITPFVEGNVKNGAYELSLGDQVFQTGEKPRIVKKLKKNEEIYIDPGQFALLLTEEYVKIPEDKIAFISIKAKIKFKGLVNVSGFHVDPGFEGKLLFSVYNAGPSTIILSRGEKYFPIWFAELNESQIYNGTHKKQNRIPNAPIEALSQGELTSPNVLSKRIEDLDLRKNYTQWLMLTLIAIFLGILMRVFWNSNEYNEGVKAGYEMKTNEQTINIMKDEFQHEIDELKTEIKKLKDNKDEIKKSDTKK